MSEKINTTITDLKNNVEQIVTISGCSLSILRQRQSADDGYCPTRPGAIWKRQRGGHRPHRQGGFRTASRRGKCGHVLRFLLERTEGQSGDPPVQ